MLVSYCLSLMVPYPLRGGKCATKGNLFTGKFQRSRWKRQTAGSDAKVETGDWSGREEWGMVVEMDSRFEKIDNLFASLREVPGWYLMFESRWNGALSAHSWSRVATEVRGA